MNKQAIAIYDNDVDFLKWASKHLEAESLEIFVTNSKNELIELITERTPDLFILEIESTDSINNNSDDLSTLSILKKIKLIDPEAMIILNGFINSTNLIIEAMRLGAFDILRKEDANFEIKKMIERALSLSEKIKESNKSNFADSYKDSNDLIIGKSSVMQDVYKLIGKISRTEAPILITGESGVGKEVIANTIYKFSSRSKSKYIVINCATIPNNLIESELFGHEKGSFTGAINKRIGRFEECDGGTLFLDEIGELSLDVQSKLLRVLQSGDFSRVGGSDIINSDVRILAATNKNLEEEVKKGLFRSDLFYRLNVIRMHIPPLRERIEDIDLLSTYFLNKHVEYNKLRKISFSNEALDVLRRYDWPGNVRELENIVYRACILSTGNMILSENIPIDITDYNRTVDKNNIDFFIDKILNHLNRNNQQSANYLKNELIKFLSLNFSLSNSEISKKTGISIPEVEWLLSGIKS